MEKCDSRPTQEEIDYLNKQAGQDRDVATYKAIMGKMGSELTYADFLDLFRGGLRWQLDQDPRTLTPHIQTLGLLN